MAHCNSSSTYTSMLKIQQRQALKLEKVIVYVYELPNSCCLYYLCAMLCNCVYLVLQFLFLYLISAKQTQMNPCHQFLVINWQTRQVGPMPIYEHLFIIKTDSIKMCFSHHHLLYKRAFARNYINISFLKELLTCGTLWMKRLLQLRL